MAVIFACIGRQTGERPAEHHLRGDCAWNSGDAAACSCHFAADGTCTNIRGECFHGREAFTKQHEFLVTGPFQGSAFQQDVVSLKLVLS